MKQRKGILYLTKKQIEEFDSQFCREDWLGSLLKQINLSEKIDELKIVYLK